MKDSWAVKYKNHIFYFTLLEMKSYQVSLGKDCASNYLNLVSDEQVFGEMKDREVFELRSRVILPTEVL